MYGPLEYMVVEFHGNKFNGTILPTLQGIVAKDIIRIVNLLFIKKDGAGNVTSLEFEDLIAEELPALLTVVLGVITVTVTHGVFGLIGGAIVGFVALLFIVLNSLTLLAGAFIGGIF